MKTDQLIQAMAADTTRTRPASAVLPWALLAGALLAAAVGLSLLGPRPDLATALMQLRVLVKQAFPVLLAVGAFGAALRLAYPGGAIGRWGLALAAAPGVLALAVAAELLLLPRADWMPAFVGHTRTTCLASISLMSIPILAGALWALRRGASTRPTLSGCLAGLLSGGTAAAIYAVHCIEDSPLFYAAWYGLGILIVAAAGAALGNRALRW
jgi:hypothetical protein